MMVNRLQFLFLGVLSLSPKSTRKIHKIYISSCDWECSPSKTTTTINTYQRTRGTIVVTIIKNEKWQNKSNKMCREIRANNTIGRVYKPPKFCQCIICLLQSTLFFVFTKNLQRLFEFGLQHFFVREFLRPIIKTNQRRYAAFLCTYAQKKFISLEANTQTAAQKRVKCIWNKNKIASIYNKSKYQTNYHQM